LDYECEGRWPLSVIPGDGTEVSYNYLYLIFLFQFFNAIEAVKINPKFNNIPPLANPCI
jgi:hypothetical protein